MRHLILVTGLVFAICSGCNSKDSSTHPQEGESGGSPENWLTVLSDPADLKQARELAERLDRERLEAILGKLDNAFVGLDEIRLLQAHEEEVRRRMRPLIERGKVSRNSIAAAFVLCQLGDFSGLPHIVRALESGSDEQRLKVLSDLDYSLVKRPEVRNDQRLQRALLAQLDHANPDVVKAAIQDCGSLHVPGAAEKFAKLLEGANPPDPGRLCYWLSQLDPRPEFLRRVIGFWKDEKQSLDHWAFVALSEFAECDDAQTRQAAREKLRKIVDAKLPQLKNQGHFDSGRYQLEGAIDALVQHATKDETAWLKSLLREPLSSWRKANVLSALARVGGEEGKAHLFEIKDPELRSSAVPAFGEAFANTGNARAIERLLNIAAGEKSSHQAAEIALALNRIGGEGKSAALRLADRLKATDRRNVMWAVEGWSAETQMDEVVETGAIGRADYKNALREIRQGEYYEPDQPIGLESVLFHIKVGLAFDAETGLLPCRHDLLLLDFADASNGLFQPAAVSEQWHQQHAEDYEAAYTLQFISEGRLYRARLRNFGDWYDVERIAQTINRALADAGRTPRFIALESGDQTAEFLFGDPQILTALAKKFQIPLTDDLNQAMRSGKAFEQRAIEALDANAI